MFVYFVIGFAVGMISAMHPWKPETPPPPIQYTAPAPTPAPAPATKP